MIKLKPKILLFFMIVYPLVGVTQKLRTSINGYGHMDCDVYVDDSVTSFLDIGEHDLFITSALTNNISFLGEIVVKPLSSSPSGFGASIERARLKFQYYKNHSLIIGKMHTPVSFWNDVYHHGRVFFPTIDRPLSFSYFTPVHVVGIRFQGQNLGDLNFGYDVVLGNTTMTGQLTGGSTRPSITLAAHIKPKDQMRIGFGLFNEDYKDADLSGHNHSHGINTVTEQISFNLANFSFANFGNKLHVLDEFSMNITSMDSIGMAENFSNYIYIGVPIKERYIPFFGFDFLSVEVKDQLNREQFRIKYFAGYRHEFTPMLNVKAQVEYYYSDMTYMNRTNMKWEYKIQLAYGF
ncbi:MAG: hypothetical protein P8M05_02020 [Flavobacteriales bacterium]|nr:hypothetical protein [Flavobacteriales bacterium]